MGIQSIQSGTDIGGSASSAADEPPRRNPKHKTRTIGRERAATRSARMGPKRVQPTKDTPCVVVVGTEPLALGTGMPALRLLAATRLHSARRNCEVAQATERWSSAPGPALRWGWRMRCGWARLGAMRSNAALSTAAITQFVDKTQVLTHFERRTNLASIVLVVA